MSIKELLATYRDLAAPATKEVTVEYEGVTHTFRTRLIGFRDANAINLSLLGADGKVDVAKVQPYREKLLAGSIAPDDGDPDYTADDVGRWPVALAELLEKAVRKANGQVELAGEAAAKNS